MSELDLDEVKKKFDDVQNHLPYLGDLWKANREIFMLLIKEVERLRVDLNKWKNIDVGLLQEDWEETQKENAKLKEANKNLMKNIGRN